MDIQIQWQKPLLLAQNKVLKISDRSIPEVIRSKPGVYFFSRRFGKRYEPFYIGETEDLRGRLRNHLRDVHVVDVLRGMRIEGFPNILQGQRFFHYGYFKAKQAQVAKKCLRIVQNRMIEEALLEELPLLNTQLTRVKTHTLKFTGNKMGRAIYKRSTQVRALG